MRNPENLSKATEVRSSNRIDVRTLWAWVGSPTAVGYPLIFFLAVYPMLIGWLQPPPPELAIEINYHLFDLLSGLGAAATVLLLRFAIKSLGQGNLRNTVIVLGWFIAGYIGALLQYNVALSVGEVSPIYKELLPVGGLSFWTLSFCFTVLASVIIQNRQTSKELARARTRLDFLQKSISEQINESKENFQTYVREKISPELELLSNEVEKLTSETSEVSRLAATQQIRTVALDIIRPLSHELYSADAQMQSERSDDESQPVTRVTVRHLISRRMNVSSVFSPALPAILILAFYSVSFYIIAGWPGVIEGCFATTAVVSLLLTLLNRLTVGRELNSLLVLLIGITTAAALSYLYVLIPNVLNLEIPADFLAFLALGAGLVLVGTTIVFFLYDTWIFALNRTKETNEENASLVARSRQEVWLRQKQIAKTVHGSIQSRLNAARIKLTQAESITPQLIETVLSDLESAKQELSLPVTDLATDIQSQLSDLTEFWLGVCAITHNLDQQSKLSLLADSSAAQAVMEVVSEGVSNAVKHSQAKEIQLSITQASPVSVSVDLQHASMNGSAQSTNSGLGTQIMNQLTLNWSFNIDGGKAQLLAQIPVART